MSTALRLVPDHERPRERLIRHGPSMLADRELLAMVVRCGTYDRSAIDLATELIYVKGSLHNVASAHVDELRRVEGMGLAKSASVVAAFELGRRAQHEPIGQTLASSEDIVTAARPYIDGIAHERMLVLIADASLRLLRTIAVSEGTKTSTLVSPRDIMQVVLRSDGSSFALAHNHPSGNPEPSAQDLRATCEVSAAAAVVGVRFLDHVVVTKHAWRSIDVR